METTLIAPFSLSALPRIRFGPGLFYQLVSEIETFGSRMLLVTGAGSFAGGEHYRWLQAELEARRITWFRVAIGGEPTPEMVDEAVARFGKEEIAVVVGVGGGSALDAAKAIAGLLRTGTPVCDHLEGVGPELPYLGPAVPFIAVPTTAGTGSEMTKNAVITRPGRFKKSFRDEALLARLALVDPELLLSCPQPVLLANAMDAFTQLLEAYTSTRASRFTDALAEDGIRAFAAGFAPGAGQPVRDYSALSYAAMLSGICLAQAGLGAVHGMASPLGACFPVPHGMVCGILLADTTRANIAALRERAPLSPALDKYARVARWLSGDDGAGAEDLAGLLQGWTRACRLPRLADYGMAAADIPRVVAMSGGNSMQTNPLVLTEAELGDILRRCL
ncbi:iron-containing alcohol dehydrogenase [Zobellella iuensis]|uniref:Iron-containing alcohol dehydrogenase n=1 Tax=Zobellella iuensis TaxID=2803811 RepID=A0ABS1QQR8_9GAMM|nr:iron-containing alcohol dehydrogenase [Zobellella iuensis]MBL1377213.1 iron-containing alcohol dehydrogenase [Zobellella iuensis]